MRPCVAVPAGVVAAAVLAGCYDPHAPAGAPCSPTLTCPAPLVCAAVNAGLACIEPGGSSIPHLDSPIAIDSPTDDAVMPDAHPDAPPQPDGPLPAQPWVLVQTADIEDTPAITIPATRPGSVLVVGLETDLASPTAVTDTAGDTFTAVAGSVTADHAANTGLEVWIAPAGHGGATKITVAVLPTHTIYSIAVWEVANLRATSPIDAVATLSDQGATTTPTGATVQTTQRGDFVVGIAIVANVVSGLTNNSLFTNDLNTHGNGWAHLTSATADPGMYRPRWNQPTSGTYCATSVALFAAQP